MIPPDYELALRERVAAQTRLEQARDVAGLCEFILPAYRVSAEKLAQSAASLQEFTRHVCTAELISFAIDRYRSVVERFGGSPAALVRTAVSYNASPEPARFRTIWVRVNGRWYTTATGKFGALR